MVAPSILQQRLRVASDMILRYMISLIERFRILQMTFTTVHRMWQDHHACKIYYWNHRQYCKPTVCHVRDSHAVVHLISRGKKTKTQKLNKNSRILTTLTIILCAYIGKINIIWKSPIFSITRLYGRSVKNHSKRCGWKLDSLSSTLYTRIKRAWEISGVSPVTPYIKCFSMAGFILMYHDSIHDHITSLELLSISFFSQLIWKSIFKVNMDSLPLNMFNREISVRWIEIL